MNSGPSRRDPFPLGAGAVLACIDGSRYSDAVCDHALWFAEKLHAELALLHVEEASSRGHRPPLAPAAKRLKDEGAGEVRSIFRQGSFREVASGLGDEQALIVLGKRGEHSDAVRGQMGSNVEGVLRSTTVPVCVAPIRFLPINRALVVIDPDPQHRVAVEFTAVHAALQSLQIDLVMIGQDSTRATAKLDWARERLGARNVDVYSVGAADPDEAASLYLERNGSDLLILSREVLLADPETRIGQIEAQSLWRWRIPVLVC